MAAAITMAVFYGVGVPAKVLTYGGPLRALDPPHAHHLSDHQKTAWGMIGRVRYP